LVKILKNIALFPLYIASILTQAKSFQSNYIIGSKTLNICGLHIFRVLFSRLIFLVKSRLILAFLKVDKHQIKSFYYKGYILIENFLDQDSFSILNSSVRNWQGEILESKQGNSIVQRLFLNHKNRHLIKNIDIYFNNQKLAHLHKFTSALNEFPRTYIEKVIQNTKSSDKADPQKSYHIDTFHPTVKSWLYLDDVDDSNGTFCYIPSSHRLTWQRLKWEYSKSINAKNTRDGYTEKGSFRVSEKDREYLKLNNIKYFKVPKNTLLIANTNGVHGRGNSTSDNSARLAIFTSSRSNPFNPLIFPFSKYSELLRDRIFNYLQYKQESKAAKNNRKSPWYRKIISLSN
jgi:ectoine hydroxylase-related dioxygenase (phytanoyl-CoA dioxygenase family)